MFTKEQIEEIGVKLNALAKRDTDLPAACPFDGTEFVPVVQDAENRNATIRQIAAAVYENVVKEFVTDLYFSRVESNTVMMWTIENAINTLCMSIARVVYFVGQFSERAKRLLSRTETLEKLVVDLDDLVEKLKDFRKVTFTINVSLEEL